MTDRKQILVVVEPDKHPEVVLKRAAWLAGLDSHSVTLLWCDPDIGPLGAPFFVSNAAKEIGKQILRSQMEIIDELAIPVRDQGLSVTTRVLEERPIAEGVLRVVEELQPEYLVKGTEYHAAAERSIFIDTDWQLLRSCPCPLWLVKPSALSDRPLVIASVDPVHSHDKSAALDQIIIDQANRIAGKSGGELHLLHSYDTISGIGAAAIRTLKPIKISVDEISQSLHKEHLAKLQKLAEGHDIDAEHMHQVAGPARDVIPSFSRGLPADLVVMGSLARWGLKRSVIGSTAERVMDRLPCDILIVRADSAGS